MKLERHAADVKSVVPVAIAGFKCIAADCEDNCCRVSTWNINIDDRS